MADYKQQSETLVEQVKTLRNVVNELDKVSETIPAAEFGALSAFTDTLVDVADSIDGVAAALEDGGIDLSEAQSQMARNRQSRELLSAMLSHD